MKIKELYNELKTVDPKSHHLILAKLFTLVFGRELRVKEWPFFRKIIRIFGSETVFWAIINSARASGTVLPYIYKVCMGETKSIVEDRESYDSRMELNTRRVIDTNKNFVRPNLLEYNLDE